MFLTISCRNLFVFEFAWLLCIYSCVICALLVLLIRIPLEIFWLLKDFVVAGRVIRGEYFIPSYVIFDGE